MIKTLLYPVLLFSLFILHSCNKEEAMRENQERIIPKELLGKWYSQVPESRFYEIDFTPQAIRFTTSAGTKDAQTSEWSNYRFENDHTLSIRRFDEHHQQDADFKLPFVLSDDGLLRINHLAPSVANVIGKFPGDRSWYGDIWFSRNKK